MGIETCCHIFGTRKPRTVAPAETCSSDAVVLELHIGVLKGGIVVNHSDGMQPYAPNQKFQWKINIPDAMFVSFNINYLAVAAGSDDHLLVCHSRCSSIKSNDGYCLKDYRMDSKTSVEFTCGDHIPFESRGWELTYTAGNQMLSLIQLIRQNLSYYNYNEICRTLRWKRICL